jgi:8-oxo-dGTP diphosphatase
VSTVAAVTLWLVRHAHAGDRHRWDGDQDERPLSKRGKAQAEAMTHLLVHEAVQQIHSSSTARCVQTVEPLAVKLGLEVELAPELYEGTSGDRALALVDSLADTNAVLCSHGDVIPNLLRALRSRGLELNRMGACEKASVWRVDLDGTSPPQVVAATYTPPPA